MSSNRLADSEALEAQALRLFAESLDVPDDRRSDWIAVRCADRPELEEKVRALAEAERESVNQGFLSAPPPMFVSDRSGERLGAFEIAGLLAMGGMSAVYRARRADGAYEQEVAVKVFSGAHLDLAARQRFDAERQMLASLDHPGIARIIDGGTTDDGAPYVVMELVRGEPITRYCNHRGVDLVGRLELVREVCDALADAHRQGIAHRDIKPGNVLVNESGQPKLIDFGIAKFVAPEDGDELPETRQDDRLMTPEYASPEQLRGDPTGKSTDLYSLGVLLYELLAGGRPHQLSGLSSGEMERTVCETVPADPSDAVARRMSTPPRGLGDRHDLRRRLKGDLDRVVMTAMRREPAHRYPSPSALAADLDNFLSGRPVTARGASRLYRASKFVSRHRWGVAATVAAFGVLLLALAAVRMQAEEARTQRDLARQEAARAESARDFLVEMIGRADPFENADAPTLAGSLRQALPGLDDRFSGQPALEADLRYAIGYALQNLGEVAPAREQLERALELRRHAGSPVDRAEVHDGLGIVAWWESDFAAGSAYFERALALLEGHESERASLLRVNVLANWAAMMIDAGDNERSEALALQALTAAEGNSAVDDETLAAIWSSIATARDGLGRPEEALAAFENTMEIQRRATGEMHPSYAIVLNNLALMYYGMDRLDDAMAAMQRSVEIRRATLGSDHPQTATALFNLARLQTIAGDLQSAERHAREALDVATRGYEPGHPRIGKAHEALAIVLDARGRLDAALEHARTARAIYEEAPGVDPAWLAAVEALIEKVRSGALAASGSS